MAKKITNMQATRLYVESLKKERDQLEAALRTLLIHGASAAPQAEALLKKIDDRG